MIVSSTPRGFLVVTQSDHARFAAELLRLFRLPELALHPRRETLLRAIAEHDNGWWEADAAPRLDARAEAPLDFRAFPPEPRREIWLRGVERFAAGEPYLAALIATHALRLFGAGTGDPFREEFSAALRERRDELLGAADASPGDLALDDPWMELADNLSLAVCTGEAAFVTNPGWSVAVAAGRDPRGERGATGGCELGLEPFPLAGTTRFEVACRRLAPGRFANATELVRALAAAPWTRFEVRVRPL